MQKKIKVLVVDGIYPPAYTGSGLRAHRTYKRLSSNYPIEFAVLTTTKGGFKPGPDEYDGVKIYRTRANKSFISQLIQVYVLFKKYRIYDFDLVHGFGDSLVVLATGLIAKYFSMRLFYEITIIVSGTKNSLFNHILNGINYLRFGYARGIIYNYGDLFIALNESIKKYYIHQGISDSKIWKRPNPVDSERFYLPEPDEKDNIRKKLGIPIDRIVVLTVGKFEPRKNQIFALRAMNGLSDNYYLVMVGPTDKTLQWYFDEIISEIDKNRMNNRVRIFPEFRDDIEIFYKASDILWITSYSEGTPNVMLEALCCGIPVLVNKNLHLGEYLLNDRHGIQLELSHDNFYNYSKLYEKNINVIQNRVSIARSANRIFSSELIDKIFFQKLGVAIF
jgi:glycosyltransferase involved in cell wall biosynthesis